MAVVWNDETTNRIREIAMKQHRRVFAIGRRTEDGTRLVQRCSWCGCWLEPVPTDEVYKVSHGLCADCKSHEFPDEAA